MMPELLSELVAHALSFVRLIDVAPVFATARRFSFTWYSQVFTRVVVVPNDLPTINGAINLLADDGLGGNGGRGLVIVRPGTYTETVRVTQNCHLLGLGPKGSVVVEAPGWESALVFAGLGVKGFNSGEDACILNVTFRCRNENMRGRCVYIVMGQPRLERCIVEGGLVVAGMRTFPQLYDCKVHGSRGSGLHFTDHSRGSICECMVARHGRHGALLDRHARPKLECNQIKDNRGCGIKFFTGPGTEATTANANLFPGNICHNILERNEGGKISVTPLVADPEECVLDFDQEHLSDDNG